MVCSLFSVTSYALGLQDTVFRKTAPFGPCTGAAAHGEAMARFSDAFTLTRVPSAPWPARPSSKPTRAPGPRSRHGSGWTRCPAGPPASAWSRVADPSGPRGLGCVTSTGAWRGHGVREHVLRVRSQALVAAAPAVSSLPADTPARPAAGHCKGGFGGRGATWHPWSRRQRSQAFGVGDSTCFCRR